jgi:hypothetical protein
MSRARRVEIYSAITKLDSFAPYFVQSRTLVPEEGQSRPGDFSIQYVKGTAQHLYQDVCVRSAIPETNPLARCEFATLRERLIKIGARVIEHIARIRVLPTSCPEGALFRAVALGLMPSGP